MFLFSKRIYGLFAFFLIISTTLNAQTYELVDQNKEWDSDDKKPIFISRIYHLGQN